MKTSNKYAHLKIVYNRSKLGWYWSPLFIAFWIILFFIIVIPSYNQLPDTLRIQDEPSNPGRFIGERAEATLLKLSQIGPKVFSSPANEHSVIEMLLNEIKKIRQNARSDLYKIEHEVQVASGKYIESGIINMYQTIQNVIVKITPKNIKDNNGTLLVNSHFDTSIDSPGVGDDGFMVAIMLEILRCICHYKIPLKHSIIFLFNGAEEYGRYGSHAFITQHRWAKNVSAFINLDSAGSGGREMLFQSVPNNTWLLRYYGQYAKHHFASTMAEEIFQRGLIPSVTDFKIFRDYGNIPGLDFASVLNGYVYHTKFDRFNVIPRNSYQSTGDNMLELIKALAVAPELEMNYTKEHDNDQMVFFDVLGWFFIYYSETTGIIINCIVCVLALITILAFIWNMSHQTGMFRRRIFTKFGILLSIQCVTVILSILLTLFLAIFIDFVGLSLSWYSHKWMIFGLYFCPMFFILGIIPAIYLSKQKEHGLPLGYAIQLFMHSQCLILIIIIIFMMTLNIRSAFLVMISIAFYTLSVILNIVTCFHNKTFLWLIPHIVCQLIPFLFFSYVCYVFFETLVPIQGRIGVDRNPELIIAMFTIFMSLLFVTFLIPICWLFRKSKTIISCFAIIFVALLIFAITPWGFPYTEKEATQRFDVMHTIRTFHWGDRALSTKLKDSGYYVLPYDRRTKTLDSFLKTENLEKNTTCITELSCGYPTTNNNGFWLKSKMPQKIGWPTLKILSKGSTSLLNVQYVIEISGPEYMYILIKPIMDAKLLVLGHSDWRLNYENFQSTLPIRFIYALDSAPLRLNLEFERASANWTGPSFEMAIMGHKMHGSIFHTDDFRNFLSKFPPWAHVTAWTSSYENWRL